LRANGQETSRRSPRAASGPGRKGDGDLPLLAGDFYGYEHLLAEDDRALVPAERATATPAGARLRRARDRAGVAGPLGARPAMFRLEKIGAFALTEPHGGSDVARGLETTARREGDEWVLDGAKRWIGNATFADHVVVWARDVEDDSVKGFVVDKGTPGFTATKMEGKLALRIVQNADIALDGCRAPDADRLQRANSFRDTGRVLCR
jgi:hypothetical protein